MDAVEKRLGLTPLETGESRAFSVSRLVIYPPVGIEFEVVEDDKRVFVHSIHATR